MQLNKIKDKNNKELLLDPFFNGKPFQVMMEWEKPYMKKLVKNLKPKGDVLEIGFGLGYSASEIQKYNIKSHTIIEPAVIKDLKFWSKKQKHKVNIVKGYWQKELKNLGKFDSIFFDDAPNNVYKDVNNVRIYKFIYELLNNHVNKNARLTWFCVEPIHFLCHPSLSWDINVCKINVPKNCNYNDAASRKKLHMPLVTFKYGTTIALNQKALNNQFKLERIN